MFYLPTPTHENRLQGVFDIGLQTAIVLGESTGELGMTGAKQLQAEIRRFTGFELPILRGESRDGDIALLLDAAQKEQGYRLLITPQLVSVAGGDPRGLLHGVQTLRQIIRQEGCCLNGVEIVDAPSLSNRGYYLDVTRGRVPTLATLKALADELCFYKQNQLQLYIEHTYLYRDLTELYRLGNPLTAEEIMELDAYCAARGIELVPSFSCFGHLFELLHTKTYNGLCELSCADTMPSTMPNRMHHHTLNVSDPRALPLIKQLIAEVMPLFRSRHFNICADETFDLGKDRSRTAAEKAGERDYYMGFVKELCDFVVKKGRTPMFWGDIIRRFPDAVAMLPKGTVCLTWGYAPDESEQSARAMARAGAAQYLCPGVCGWNYWMPLLRSSYENIRRMSSYARKYKAMGLLNTDWGDYGHINDNTLSLPGLIYGAAMAWSEKPVSFDALNEAISHLTYLDRSGSVVGLLAQLEVETACHWRDLVRYKDGRQGTLSERPVEWTADVQEHNVRRCNDALAQTMAELRQRVLEMDTSMRERLQAWTVAGEGVRLWNLTGAAVAARRIDQSLATALERWFESYKRLWRATCRESELHQIADVVSWYADQLRP
ncbi:MAG: glycoside hydrolase family 20 zincin-like fold domain-containing protein [Eubacteriales bacterium]|nr:glycoside hydrolase family 20 zincin-like fold domain-containing protein [Eubacteriales bacterium]